MAVQNNLQAKAQNNGGLTAYLTNDAVKAQINNVLGGAEGTKFITSIVSSVQATPTLKECTNPSILSAALLGASLKLSPSPQLGQFYMVPFDNKKKGCKEAQFQLGYKGYVQLAIRSSYYKKLNVLPIKAGELVKYDPLNEEIEINLIEDDEEREKAETTGYYAFFEYENGFRKCLYWSKKKMEAHAEKYSQGYRADKRNNTQYTFWAKDFDAMALKTMLRQLISKWGILSIDMQKAFDADMGVIKQDGTIEYVDNQPDEPQTVEIQAKVVDPKPQQTVVEPTPARDSQDETDLAALFMEG